MSLSIKSPIQLPCGLVLENRLVKAAMAEAMADGSHLPNKKFVQAYGEWAKGGWGAILTGNIQVDVSDLGNYNDLATGEYSSGGTHAFDSWRLYATTCQQHGTPAVAQICHPGRQSPRGAGKRGILSRAIAPSAVPLNIGNGFLASFIRSLAFGTPREMSQRDIEHIISQFVNSARVLAECGFAGIELHAAHGYLLSQFLSLQTNLRHDEYGGTPEKRASVVLEIIRQIRAVVPKKFCIGIKLNSADHNTSDFEDTMRQIQLLAEIGVDFLEISGGTYEDPTMMGRGLQAEMGNETTDRTLAREAFFLDFAAETRKRFPDLILMLTGGFRSRKGAEAALQSRSCDLIGIGRPAVVTPNLPQLMLEDMYSDDEASMNLTKVPPPLWARVFQIRVLGGGAETQFYSHQIRRMAAGLSTHAP